MNKIYSACISKLYLVQCYVLKLALPEYIMQFYMQGRDFSFCRITVWKLQRDKETDGTIVRKNGKRQTE